MAVTTKQRLVTLLIVALIVVGVGLQRAYSRWAFCVAAADRHAADRQKMLSDANSYERKAEELLVQAKEEAEKKAKGEAPQEPKAEQPKGKTAPTLSQQAKNFRDKAKEQRTVADWHAERAKTFSHAALRPWEELPTEEAPPL
jgi:hypothetical protein